MSDDYSRWVNTCALRKEQPGKSAHFPCTLVFSFFFFFQAFSSFFYRLNSTNQDVALTGITIHQATSVFIWRVFDRSLHFVWIHTGKRCKEPSKHSKLYSFDATAKNIRNSISIKSVFSFVKYCYRICYYLHSTILSMMGYNNNNSKRGKSEKRGTEEKKGIWSSFHCNTIGARFRWFCSFDESKQNRTMGVFDIGRGLFGFCRTIQNAAKISSKHIKVDLLNVYWHFVYILTVIQSFLPHPSPTKRNETIWLHWYRAISNNIEQHLVQ